MVYFCAVVRTRKGNEVPDLETMKAVMKPWANAQGPMAAVRRWGNFPTYGQTLLMHNNSVMVVAVWVCSVVERNHPTFRKSFVYEALIFHDHGEPLTGGDEHIGAQTPGKEVREWEAFETLVTHLPDGLRKRLMSVFTLQFCRKPAGKDLPGRAKADLGLMRAFSKKEAIVFEFIERLDYLFTALDGHNRDVCNEKEGMLEHCLRNQSPRLAKLCNELPVLSQIWTNTLQDELHSLAAQH